MHEVVKGNSVLGLVQSTDPYLASGLLTDLIALKMA